MNLSPASVLAEVPTHSAIPHRSRPRSKSATHPAAPSDRRPPDGIEWDTDLPGLGLRTRCGRQTWIIQYRKQGRSIRRTLGAPPSMDRDAARIVARDRLLPSSTPAAQPEPHHDTTTRFEDFLPVFLKHSRNRWKVRTHAKVTTMSRALIPVFGAKPIASIGRTEVASWLGGLKGCNIWPLCIMSSVMKHAEDLGIRPPGSNPCAGMRRKKTRFAGRHLGADDYGALGRALRKHCPMPNPAGALLRFVALTGCRRSEAFDLQWDNLHGDRAVLADSKTGPKTIWLGTAARAVLDAMPRTDGPWIFRDKHRVKCLTELYEAWHAVRIEAGLDGLRIHDLRHGFASVGISMKMDLPTIAGLLGHADIATTNGYAHLRSGHLSEAVARVAARIAGPLPTSPPEPSRPRLRPSKPAAAVKAKSAMDVEIALYLRARGPNLQPLSPRDFCLVKGLDFDVFKNKLADHRRSRSSAPHASSPAAGGAP
jgi:hypothetical protein